MNQVRFRPRSLILFFGCMCVTLLLYELLMSFKEARSRLIAALAVGDYEHEARQALAEKNLLAIGTVTAGFVIRLLRKARGHDHRESAHHWDDSVTVHSFRCRDGNDLWYIKAYFIESTGAVFICVHRSE